MLDLLLDGLLGRDISRHGTTEGDTAHIPVTRRGPPLNGSRRDTNCRGDLSDRVSPLDEQALCPEAVSFGSHTLRSLALEGTDASQLALVSIQEN